MRRFCRPLFSTLAIAIRPISPVERTCVPPQGCRSTGVSPAPIRTSRTRPAPRGGFTDSVRCELAHDRSQVHITMVHLSAFNTPQFEWGRTTLHQRPRPMGRIFQPEVGAQGVYWAATHRRRELWVGWPAVKAIWGTRLIPGVLDRMLGRTAVAGQHTGEPLPPHRQDNLYTPVPGDHGAHGRFDAQARPFSLQFWLNTHRAGVMTALALGAGWWWTLRMRRR